jgi:hypothetical protein
MFQIILYLFTIALIIGIFKIRDFLKYVNIPPHTRELFEAANE